MRCWGPNPTAEQLAETLGAHFVGELLRPDYDAPVEAIPTCLAEGEQPKYPPTTSIAHLQECFGATLPYLDETLVDRG